MRSPYYSDVYWNCCEFLLNASEEARKEFFARVNKRINKPDLVTENDLRKASLEFSIDFSNNLYRLGDGFVYAYITDAGELFYIGCGQSDRVCNTHSRSEDFKAVHNDWKCYPFVLASNVYKANAEEIETLCIWLAQMNGCVLENSKKTLNSLELKHFLLKEKGADIKLKDCVAKKWEQYEELKADYEDVVASFMRLLYVCLDKEEFDQKVPREKEHKPSPDLEWTIDGKTKTITEWCEQYGRSRGSAIARVNAYGFTPKQALTFPPVPRKFSRKPIEYWQSLGLLPEDYSIDKVV